MTPDRSESLWSHVHLLTVIAQAGSFTGAAQRLGLSKAAVSQRVAELERSVNLTLVRRTTRSVRLTDAGQRLVDDTAESFAQIARSVADVRDLAGEPRGLVRVTAPVALGRQHIAPTLERFFRSHPQVRVELELSDRLAKLAHEGFDLAVRHTSSPPDNHIAWKLCESRTLLVASAGYLRRKGVPQHPSELAEHDCLAYLRSGPTQWLFEQADRPRAGHDPERVSVGVQGPLSANNSELLRDAVLSGLGIAQIPDFSVAAALRAGRLREVLPGWRPVGFFGDAIFAIRPWSRSTPKAVQVLVDHWREQLAGGFGA
ncbi:LysR family transcriptional regulator [Piscinibacter terrae]|uniref:LysR family transcriptional regulator n=1 Tax=Piscinibacter terrae TaxID=2496871 RepID=A0A3N7HPD5_9BURK|nr:LysR family transcriptional regulator [Albitalea terrae]RQP24014.1 LysR family transcriptional regulator [Albitalea terrae]